MGRTVIRSFSRQMFFFRPLLFSRTYLYVKFIITPDANDVDKKTQPIESQFFLNLQKTHGLRITE